MRQKYWRTALIGCGCSIHGKMEGCIILLRSSAQALCVQHTLMYLLKLASRT